MVASRYTGFDGYASGKRAGTEQFVREFVKHTGGAFWNNGTFVKRPIRGGTRPSNHGTGRATDLSYRGAPYKGCGDRRLAEKWIDWLVDHANDLHIEIIVDYMPKPYGRTWKCDRQKWRRYLRPTISSGGKSYADWIHVEIAPDVADDAEFFKRVFSELGAVGTVAPSQPAKHQLIPYRGRPIRRGEKDKELVRMIQRVVRTIVDGDFGPVTERAVMRWQGKNGCYPDGWIGPQTWAAMAPHFNK